MMNLQGAHLSESRGWKDGAAFSGCVGHQGAAQASFSLTGKAVHQKALIMSGWAGSLLPSEHNASGPLWVLFVFCSPQELKTGVDPGISTAAPSQSPWLWTAWCSPWLAPPPGLLLCTRCSAWMTTVASHHHGNSLRPSQRGTLPRGWAPPMRLWAPAYGPQPRNHRLKVSHREGGNRLVGLLMHWLPVFESPMAVLLP